MVVENDRLVHDGKVHSYPHLLRDHNEQTNILTPEYWPYPRVSEIRTKTDLLGIRIICLCEETYLPLDCYLANFYV